MLKDTHRLELDIGLVPDAVPTTQPAKADVDDPDSVDQVIEIYDISQHATRCPALARGYGNWQRVHGGSKGRGGDEVMLFNVIERVKQESGLPVTWAEGLEQTPKLGTFFKQPPGGNAEASCGEMLSAALAAAELKFKITRRPVWADYYDLARKWFNEVHKRSDKSAYGERARFSVALNYYNQGDYARMKTVLKEYLKIFDSPSNEYYHEVCFWVGWLLEKESNYREAQAYYARAVEERLVLTKNETGKPLVWDELKKMMGLDTQFALGEPVSGGPFEKIELKDFARFFQLNARVEIQLSAAARAMNLTIDRPAFKNVPRARFCAMG